MTTGRAKQELSDATARTQKAIEGASNVILQHVKHLGESGGAHNENLYSSKIHTMAKFVLKELELYQQTVDSIANSDSITASLHQD